MLYKVTERICGLIRAVNYRVQGPKSGTKSANLNGQESET